ncbi:MULTISPECIES: aminoacyl-tRNA hydrolase [unclassified Achromobacter]|uniref:aminoacyl-tRNA hydrolase n=1 Tax=unclassified Achromobacter TaxID=2626865 RepID=UPI000B515DB2|nr:MULTISPECIES: aminoacyl-tRNA hydrolase [unclassified Achromobacter]OWT74783.1 aminoacyl-tRNA hydrolase [Achromobacter sp. HZ34]OWT79250.1 aminoacyl-tRNA hydrolase [Achromobacter sp. HZ28]
MSTPIRLIVGLGNPGPEYETTRHNAGFWLADHVADDLRASFTMEKGFSGFVAKGRHGGENVVLLKPMTYMNKSGQSVGAVARFFKFTPEQVLVLHDELDLMPGEVKLKQGGGHAGHNGLRDIQSALGSPAFWRLRLGIGHPRTLGLAQQVADFVLHTPRREEMTGIETVIDRCRAVMPLLLDGEFTKATQQLHRENKA